MFVSGYKHEVACVTLAAEQQFSQQREGDMLVGYKGIPLRKTMQSREQGTLA